MKDDKTMKLIPSLICVAAVTAIAAVSFDGKAATTYLINNTTADAFIATGSPSNPGGTNMTGLNFGGGGTLAISSASSPNGAFDSLLKFNLGGAVSQFNSTYGAGNWQITGMTLSLASNFGTQGAHPNNGIFNNINTGMLGVDWLGYDGWTEGTGGGRGPPGYSNKSKCSYNCLP